MTHLVSVLIVVFAKNGGVAPTTHTHTHTHTHTSLFVISRPTAVFIQVVADAERGRRRKSNARANQRKLPQSVGEGVARNTSKCFCNDAPARKCAARQTLPCRPNTRYLFILTDPTLRGEEQDWQRRSITTYTVRTKRRAWLCRHEQWNAKQTPNSTSPRGGADSDDTGAARPPRRSRCCAGQRRKMNKHVCPSLHLSRQHLANT